MLSSSVDIPLSKGPVNLNWGPIVKTINESPYDFFRQAGWSFLGGGGAEVRSSISFYGPFPVLTTCLLLVERR